MSEVLAARVAHLLHCCGRLVAEALVKLVLELGLGGALPARSLERIVVAWNAAAGVRDSLHCVWSLCGLRRIV